MNPIARRISRTVALAGMRPPLTEQLYLYRPTNATVPLNGKRVLITGASSGIGESAAALFAREKATVIAVARRKDLLDEVVQRIENEGGAATAVACDLSQLDAVDALVERVDDEFGGVDILINNAAHSIRRPLAESLDRWHDLERTMTLNYFSPLRLVRGLAPGMRERGDGHIINVATWGVFNEAAPLFAAYNASKAALSSVSRVMETEWANQGVRSTTLYYPLVITPMIAPTKAYEGLPGLTAEEAAQWMIIAAKRRPVRIAPRIGLLAKALDTVSPEWINALMKRQRIQPGK